MSTAAIGSFHYTLKLTTYTYNDQIDFIKALPSSLEHLCLAIKGDIYIDYNESYNPFAQLEFPSSNIYDVSILSTLLRGPLVGVMPSFAQLLTSDAYPIRRRALIALHANKWIKRTADSSSMKELVGPIRGIGLRSAIDQ